MIQNYKVPLRKSSRITWVFCAIIAAALIAVIIMYVLFIHPLQNATVDYNTTVHQYNSVADSYNSMAEITAIDNIDGFLLSVDKLYPADDKLSSVVKSFFSGNTAEKTRTDIQTIKKLIGSLSDDLHIMEQITAPSEAWVIARLKEVDDILSIQAVTQTNDPNGLLNKENGGYSACIYFTSTGIDESNQLGNYPVEKGTDGGGAVEIYSSLADAEARCEYLSSFDNTILYTGSYAIIGTMVIRISYIYTNEAQYEMTDRITKAFTHI